MEKYNKQLIENNISVKHIGNNMIFLDTVESTNLYAMELAGRGVESGSIVVSDRQSGGRGRLQRSWFSPGGVNIYMSVILKPDIDIRKVNILTFISSIATVDTLAEYGFKSDIKWPNDVLVKKKKISGVLTEINISQNRLQHVVVGVGVNLNVDSDSLNQTGLGDIATSVYMESGEKADRDLFLIKLINNMDVWYDNLMNYGERYVYKNWNGRWGGRNKTAAVNADGEEFEARCIGLDDNGYMIVEKRDGSRQTVVSGDLSVL